MSAPSIVPAPWSLRGESFIQLMLSPVEEVRGLVPEGFRIRSRKGFTLGALMWVHYTDSPVGPYEELLYMPARVRVGGRTGYCITHIWVDSRDSLESGKENWLIPKRLGTMTFQSSGRLREASLEDGSPVARMRFHCPAFPPPMPMHSVVFPMPLLQKRDQRTVFVPFGGWGLAQPVRGGFELADRRALPVPEASRTLAASRLAKFWLTFSEAQDLPPGCS
jgi:hypothetical protein